ncbi:hypothetical protein FO519_010035, partial [Halicephalobus sp. NKZ332]
MSDHNKSSSSDDSFVKLAIPYKEFDVLVSDIDERELEKIGREGEVEHLSRATFSSPSFPVSGIIHGPNIRYMIPLVVQRAGKPNSNAINVWFLVDTSSPFTCLTVKSLESFFGQGNVADDEYYRFAIQDQKSNIECRTSKGNFEFVNLLGADAMRKLKLSIDVDWETDTFKLVK